MPLAKGADATLQLGDEVAMTLDGPTYKVTLVGERAAADDGGARPRRARPDGADDARSTKRARAGAPPPIAHVVSWNCDTAAPGSGESQTKLSRMLALLRDADGRYADAIALQETRFNDHGAYLRARAAATAHGYSLLVPRGSFDAGGAMVKQQGFDTGVALLVRDNSCLAGGRLVELPPWDDERRVILYDAGTRGALVAAYMPAVSEREGRFEKRQEVRSHLYLLFARDLVHR